MHISFDWAAMFLMMLGVQWYVLFNVLAGALRIPRELADAIELMKTSRWTPGEPSTSRACFPRS